MGCAGIAWRATIPAMLECGVIDLKAVASRSREKAQRFAAHFNCGAIVGYDELLRRGDIDAVYVPLPTGLHEEWVTKSLVAGKHVFVEKAFTDDYEAAKRMVENARRNGRLIMEDFMFEHHSQYQWVAGMISEGRVGKPRLLRATFGFPPLPKVGYRYDPSLGGGALIDAGCYVVRVARRFTEGELELVGANLDYDEDTGVDLYGEAMLRNRDGLVAQVAFGFDYHYQCLCELLGTEGKITLTRAFTPPPGFRPTAIYETRDRKVEHTLPADNHFVNILRHFVEVVGDKSKWPSQFELLLSQARLLDEIRGGAK